MSQYCKCLGMFITSCENNTGCKHRTKDKESTNQNTERMR